MASWVCILQSFREGYLLFPHSVIHPANSPAPPLIFAFFLLFYSLPSFRINFLLEVGGVQAWLY